MAVAKKAKPASGKSKVSKSSPAKKTATKPSASKTVVRKPAAVKSAPKKSQPAAGKKPVASNNSALKKAGATAVKSPKSLPSKTASKKAVPAKSPAAKASPKAAVNPESAKKTAPAPSKVKASVPAVKKNTPAAAPAASKKSAPSKVPLPPKPAAKKQEKPEQKPASPVAVKKIVPAKKEQAKSEKSKPDIDPADAKAKKIMSELEETMDLSKVKPRIKVPAPPPKQIYRHAPSAPLKLIEPTNTNKQKFQLEFEFRSSPKILFNALSDSSGLAGWFADEVRTKDDMFTFVWEGGESYAKLVAIKDMYLVRFQWAEDTDGTYFQFEIKQDEITGEIALVITDFALPGERETNIRLWESQVQNLRMLLGSL